MIHKPVLLAEVLEALDLKSGEVFVDGTFGAGGHSRALLRQVPGVRIIGIDRDPAVPEHNPEFRIYTDSFQNLDKILEKEDTQPDAILLDLGISSDQIENSQRGFSFNRDEPLDMRMSSEGITAAEILNSFDESAIELILRGFGEEKHSSRIAHEIVRSRELRPFRTTGDLVEAVLTVKRRRPWDKIHPATQTFQALRIAVNDELQALERGLEKGLSALRVGGRLVVISFHSLEDRVVKNFFRDQAKSKCVELITKKPVTASEAEIETNPRSRSAKLRALRKLIQ